MMDNGNGRSIPFKAITGVLTLVLSLGGIVSWVQSTFVSQQELTAIREVVERAETTLRERIISTEEASLRQTQQTNSRIDNVSNILLAGQTEILKALMEHQRDHITSGGCPAVQ